MGWWLAVAELILYSWVALGVFLASVVGNFS